MSVHPVINELSKGLRLRKRLLQNNRSKRQGSRMRLAISRIEAWANAHPHPSAKTCAAFTNSHKPDLHLVYPPTPSGEKMLENLEQAIINTIHHERKIISIRPSNTAASR